jgi:ABC-2 type transport system ATP-binding protein
VTPARNDALRRVGALVGDPALLPRFSVRDNLRCLARLYPGLPGGRVDEVLEQVGLTAAAGRRAGALSTGMKRRLGVGLAVLGRPDLLVLDEPAQGLDPEGIHELRGLLRGLAGDGTAVFLSSHLLHEVELTCDRVGVVHHGRVVAQGTVAELTVASDDRVTVVVGDPEGAARLLRAVPDARDVEVGPAGLAVSGLTSEVVVHRLVTGGITPREVTVARPDLEDLFLALTRER